MTFVFVVLAATIVLFASDRVRLDVVALLSLLTLHLGGVLTPQETLAGFANPLVIMIAGLFVVGAGIFQTGAADRVGAKLEKLGGSDSQRLIILLMGTTAILSGLLSSTGTVAIMMPVAVRLARQAGLTPRQILLPLAFAATIGGMLTLIGTPPNLAANDALRAAGFREFQFFSFTPIGIAALAVGIVLILRRTIKRLGEGRPRDYQAAPQPTLQELLQGYDLSSSFFSVRIPAKSDFAGQLLRDLELRSRFNVNVVAVTEGQATVAPGPETRLAAGQRLYLKGTREAVAKMVNQGNLTDLAPATQLPEPLVALELVLGGRSDLIKRNLEQSNFADRYGVNVLAIRRGGSPVKMSTSRTALQTGDSLLVAGAPDRLRAIADEMSHVLVTEPAEVAKAPRIPGRTGVAIAILVGMLVLLTGGWVQNEIAVLLAAGAMVITGCLRADSVYRDIKWESVILIAAILPMATALEKTGGMDAIVNALMSTVGTLGPWATLAGLLLLTSLLSQVISNTATAVLLAPVAIAAAVMQGVQPHAFVMAVAVGASCSFASPVATPVNMLVLNPGGYKFSDFIRQGLPLQLLVLAVAFIILPILFPFG